MADAADKKRVQITSAEVLALDLPPAEAANFFAMSAIPTEVHLLIGNVVLAGARSGKLQPTITHRFILSPFAFHMLAKQIEHIKPRIVDPGIEMGVEG